jgi:hypothetical protein
MQDRSFGDMDSSLFLPRGTTLAVAAPSPRHAAMRLRCHDAFRLGADWLSGMPSTNVSLFARRFHYSRTGQGLRSRLLVFRLRRCVATETAEWLLHKSSEGNGYPAAAARIGRSKSQRHPDRQSATIVAEMSSPQIMATHTTVIDMVLTTNVTTWC